MSSNPIQTAQEQEYDYPYHYIAQFEGGFTHCAYDTWGLNYVATIEFLLDRLDQHPFSSLLDTGCGDGRLTKEIARRFPRRRIVGIDYSHQAISLAQAMYPQGEFHQLDVTKNEWGDQFDIVTLIEVFEHIDPITQGDFLRNLAKCLKPGGTLYLTVPHVNTPIGYKHFRHFTVPSISGCLAPFFNIVEVMPFEKRSIVKTMIDALLVNRVFILNHKRTRNFLYQYYKSKLFFSGSEKQCGRIFIKATLRS